MHPGVLVLDFGSQYTQLIARRIRELGVYSEIRPCGLRPAEFDLSQVKALILSGGPASVEASDAPYFDPEWLKLGLPTLGICYGLQLLAKLQGGELQSGVSREYGYATLEVSRGEGLFKNFIPGERTTVWMSHGDHVKRLPSGFISLAASSGAPLAAIGNPANKTYALQFHPEVSHTPRGKEILANFLFEVAQLKPDWSAADLLQVLVLEIRASVSEECSAVCGISGGVDSSVAGVLVHRALGERLHCIFVDNGLLRKGEAAQVLKSLGPQGLGLNVKLVDASARFLEELKGVTEPEEKRKVIGRVFIEVFEEQARSIRNATHLVQGTLYPDVIESVSVRGPSAVIKSHHNVGGLPEKMDLRLIEPLRELFKDEVRSLGRSLGIPEFLVQRQPFPGPGLAVRILGEVSPERLAVLREADAIFQEEVRAEGLYQQLWQSFAVLLPVSSVGVMGDGRTYEQTIALRAVYSEDGMTADWAYLPQELLRRVSSRIINEVRGVNRVVLDISSKPPSTIEWE
jgi:GMP synthase (glutamine-hydrolysing)